MESLFTESSTALRIPCGFYSAFAISLCWKGLAPPQKKDARTRLVDYMHLPSQRFNASNQRETLDHNTARKLTGAQAAQADGQVELSKFSKKQKRLGQTFGQPPFLRKFLQHFNSACSNFHLIARSILTTKSKIYFNFQYLQSWIDQAYQYRKRCPAFNSEAFGLLRACSGKPAFNIRLIQIDAASFFVSPTKSLQNRRTVQHKAC